MTRGPPPRAAWQCAAFLQRDASAAKSTNLPPAKTKAFQTRTNARFRPAIDQRANRRRERSAPAIHRTMRLRVRVRVARVRLRLEAGSLREIGCQFCRRRPACEGHAFPAR